MKIKDIKWLIIDFIFCVCSFVLAYTLDNEVSSLKIIGAFIIAVSIILMMKCKEINSVSLLIGIISLISISLAYSICFNTYETAFYWQIPLLKIDANTINVKNYLIFLAVFSFSIGKFNLDEKEEIQEIPKFDYNALILIGSVFILIYALIFCFDRGKIGVYSYNTNPLYEYAIIIFLFAWQYAKDNKIFKKFLIVYAILYILQGLVFGDRSSAFPMILLLLMLYTKNNIKMKNVILVGFAGILCANIIDIFRNTGDLLSIDTIRETISRGLFVNTISYSFYAGTQIIRYGLTLTFKERFLHCIGYTRSVFLGGGGKYTLSTLARDFGFANSGRWNDVNIFLFLGRFYRNDYYGFFYGKTDKIYFFTQYKTM